MDASGRTWLVRGGAGVALVLLVIRLLSSSDGQISPPSEAELPTLTSEATGSGSAPQQAHIAARRLADSKSVPHLREVMAKATEPQAKAAAIDGLAAARDFNSMPNILALLEDPDPLVRGRAGVAATKILGVDYFFRANDPPEKRAKAIKHIRHEFERMRAQPPEHYRGARP